MMPFFMTRIKNWKYIFCINFGIESVLVIFCWNIAILIKNKP
jgi:hypothetical protein